MDHKNVRVGFLQLSFSKSFANFLSDNNFLAWCVIYHGSSWISWVVWFIKYCIACWTAVGGNAAPIAHLI